MVDFLSPVCQPIHFFLSLFSKIIEDLIVFELNEYFISCDLLSDYKFGFRLSRSTADVLTVFTEFLCQVSRYDQREL